MVEKWYRSRHNLVLVMFTMILFGLLSYMSLNTNLKKDYSSLFLKLERAIAKRNIERVIQDTLKQDKGSGCEIQHLDPFAEEITRFDKVLPKVVCEGKDWVRCYLSECKVLKEILDKTKNVVCTYKDILYENDDDYTIGPPVTVKGGDSYILNKSDHVKVSCVGRNNTRYFSRKKLEWTGHSVGFRTWVERKTPPPGREKGLNVLIFGFDSAARNLFIRRMPKSYHYLVNVLNGIVLEGYNIVGDGTAAALIPMLTGKTELELPDVRKRVSGTENCDVMPLLFYRLKDDGYRTAYFEDMPWIGTFQNRLNGFKKQPADHYLRAFYLEETNNAMKWWYDNKTRYCVGDRPQYKLLQDITDQFFDLDGKKFAFTFIADISHDEINMIGTADDDTENFLKTLKERGRLEDTLVFFIGDHGPRFNGARKTQQGKLEERLPLMCLLVPPSLAKSRPSLLQNLRANTQVLTTPHDIHATLLDAMGLPNMEAFKVPGADLPRGMSLFQTIPRNRSCSEAGIEPHWCACLKWINVSTSDPMYRKVVDAIMDFINFLTEPVRSKCIFRTLTSVELVMRQEANKGMLSYASAKDRDNYFGLFTKEVKHNDTYQIKFVVGPGTGLYEASVTYVVDEDRFVTKARDISRINAYNNEPHCIRETHPHLHKFCYCNDL